MAARARSWCMTLNNWTQEEYDDLKNKGDYGIMGKEVGDSGTHHLQGFIYFKNKASLKQLKEISKRAHWEIARGTIEQASTYCGKDKDFIEWGEKPQQGKRNDIEAMKSLLTETEPMSKVCDLMNYQCTRMAEKWLTYKEPKRNWKPEVKWFHGPSGSGKTKQANLEMPNAYTKTGPSKWWDGYDGHEEVIMDDLRSSHIEFTELLMILDRYEKRVEHKGGMRQLKAKKIIITSIYSPQEMYAGMQARNNIHEPIEQLLRRIDSVINFAHKLCPEVGGNTRPLLDDSEDDWSYYFDHNDE